MVTDRTALFALQTIGRGWGVDGVEVPRGSRDVDARAVSDAVLINPEFVLVGGEPGGVGVDGVTSDEECGWSGLIPNLDVQLVIAGRDGVLFSRKLKLSVEGEVELAFGSDGNGLFMIEGKSLRELYRYVVTILLPKGRKHSASLGTTVVKNIAEPNLEIAWIPDPCWFIVCLHFA